MKLRYVLLAVPLLGAGALWLTQDAAPVHASASSTPAATTRQLIAPGHVEPVRDAVALAFDGAGRIVAISVDEGDEIRAGQVVAQLDDRLPKARVAAAKAALQQARARHLLAQRGPRREDILAARADADAAAAAAQHRGAEQARSDQLGKLGALATTVVDADDAAARIASAQASAATARYQALANGTRREQIEEASAAVALAEAELAAAEVALDQTRLLAPTDGVVLRRTAEVGALVTLMTPSPVMSVADLRELELRAEIDEADISSVAVGQTAYATADTYGDRKFPVRIERLTRELGRKTVRDDDPRARFDTRVLEVIAKFDAPTAAAAPSLPVGLRMQLHLERR